MTINPKRRPGFRYPSRLHAKPATAILLSPQRLSLSATCYSLLGGPANITRHLNHWFSTTGGWVTRCSIINTDFFDESDIVRYCWSATSMKAVYGHTLYEP
jgi:hypothetical protein